MTPEWERNVSDEIKEKLRPLFEQARREGKWLWCRYQDLWFSPDDLETKQANGKFRWGAVNWSLRGPKEYLKEADDCTCTEKMNEGWVWARWDELGGSVTLLLGWDKN